MTGYGGGLSSWTAISRTALFDVLRLVWTAGTGVGTLIMAILVWDVYADYRALPAETPPGNEAMRLIARGEVVDQCVRLLAVGALFIAGIFSYLQDGQVVIILLMVSAAGQVFLGTIKLRRRQQIFDQLRLSRAKGETQPEVRPDGC